MKDDFNENLEFGKSKYQLKIWMEKIWITLISNTKIYTTDESKGNNFNFKQKPLTFY